YRLGSVTKQFTAMAILLLEEQGKLDVQDRVCAYLEACPDGWTNITIHQLLVHTSGIPNFTSMSGFHKLKKEHSTPLQTMAFFKDEPLSFVPGEKWAYSNSGYIVLGVVLEQAAGVPYAAFLQEHIFEPLQMSDSGYEQSDSELAVGYRGRSEALFIDMSVPHAAGGLYSTVEDLYRWDRALYTNELVSDELLDKMFTPHALIPDSEGFGYGYGWGIGEQFDRLIVDHDGAIDGFASYIGRYPEEQVVIIILSNDENLHPNIISEQLAQMIFRNRN
ncbi:beta-lactamase family protein, partial [Chloroflexi bacterium TSY]|nr:beta-lactamase family protein [Chloroflexi bacterium TSY]